MAETRFASAKRSSEEEIVSQYQKFAGYPVVGDVLGKIDQYILVLNDNRQLVYCNLKFLEDFGFPGVEELIGKRVGEILKCRFAWCIDGGCGTSDFCKDCGAVQAMLKTQTDHTDIYRECVILTTDSRALELGVTSRELMIDGDVFVVFTVADISKEKQFRQLEDIFFHDLSHMATCIHSMLQIMSDVRITDKKRLIDQVTRSASDMVNELNTHTLLKAADRSELKVNKARCNSLQAVTSAVDQVESIYAGRGTIIYVHHTSEDFDLCTDVSLLNRVLINMLMNAVEASSFSQRVTVGCETNFDESIFWVHNPAYIPDNIQSKIFRQKFSTKKSGGGLGTQSIRKLTEGYLGGRVTFESCADSGTVFRIYLPKR